MTPSATKAVRIQLFSFSSPAMRAFHLSWAAFFVCFFAWFSLAPLMPVVRADLSLGKEQIANLNIAAVGITILVRLLIGPCCDKYGPRKTYTTLLVLGSLPIFGVAFTHRYESFLLLRLLIGAIGASFVVTQYHTSVMFAPNVVGTANATSAGWGNSGGGVTQTMMPWVLAAIVSFGVEKSLGWRIAMVVPGTLMLVVAVLYWSFTQDCPQGNYSELRAHGIPLEGGKKGGLSVFRRAAANYRVWMLFVTYGACFGVELFVHNVAATYYVDHYRLDLKSAGFAAGSFGLLALFGRALGGLVSDRVARLKGLDGRTLLLFTLMLGEGAGLVWFAGTRTVTTAVCAMLTFGLFTHMACGATYALVPFVDRNALGGVAGIVGAGGNVGAVLAGFLLKGLGNVQTCFAVLGGAVVVSSLAALLVRFDAEHKANENALYQQALREREAVAPSAAESAVAG